MTSLEQEESKGGESISDYDETWDTENWGDMEAGSIIKTIQYQKNNTTLKHKEHCEK